MIEGVVIGARVAMTPAEADRLAEGQIRLVTCTDGRVVGGVGPVGLVEHFGTTDLEGFVAEVKTRREALRQLALVPQNKPTFTFTRI